MGDRLSHLPAHDPRDVAVGRDAGGRDRPVVEVRIGRVLRRAWRCTTTSRGRWCRSPGDSDVAVAGSAFTLATPAFRPASAMLSARFIWRSRPKCVLVRGHLRDHGGGDAIVRTPITITERTSAIPSSPRAAGAQVCASRIGVVSSDAYRRLSAREAVGRKHRMGELEPRTGSCLTLGRSVPMVRVMTSGIIVALEQSGAALAHSGRQGFTIIETARRSWSCCSPSWRR